MYRIMYLNQDIIYSKTVAELIEVFRKSVGHSNKVVSQKIKNLGKSRSFRRRQTWKTKKKKK